MRGSGDELPMDCLLLLICNTFVLGLGCLLVVVVSVLILIAHRKMLFKGVIGTFEGEGYCFPTIIGQVENLLGTIVQGSNFSHLS